MRSFIKTLILILVSFNLSAKSFSDVNLLADANIAGPIREVVREYLEYNYISIVTQLSDYKELLNLNTKDTDVIITADEEVVKFFQGKDIIEEKILDIAGDRLVVLAESGSRHKLSGDFVKSLRKLTKYTSVVITDPQTTMSGYLANKLLLQLNIDNVVQVKDEEKAVHIIKMGKAVGLLFGSNKMDLEILAPVPVNLSEPVKYQVVVFKHQPSENITSFLKFLLLNKAILKKYGMIVNN